MRKLKKKIIRIVYSIIALSVALLGLFPLVWMALASFKNKKEVFATPLKFFPTVWTMENFDIIFDDKSISFTRSIFTTLFVSVTAVFLALLINMMAGYVFARMNFYLKKFFWVYCIISMYIPGMTILLTSFLVVQKLGMLDSLGVLILPGLVSGYSIFFFRQFFLNLPSSLEEAAMIDGAGRVKIFFKIFIPLSKSPMVVLGAGTFIGYWNSFLWPSMTISQPKYMQVIQIIRSMRSVYSTNFGAVMAGTSIAVIPPIILFFIFQKQIVKGVVLSGIK
ncbi:multiple sugar transport system permease protein [Anaerotaenia torta]|uniref:carbohydrate ABC transporter permease n=1 Tax=Anaerotaenia torta TaxID=433293 RepID=UPI003D1C2086